MARPDTLQTVTERIKTGCGSMYVTITPKGSEYKEVFAVLGKTGGCPSCNMSSLTRVVTVSLNNGTPWEVIVKQLSGARCPNDSKILPSCPEALARVMKAVFGVEELVEESLAE